MKPIYFKIIPTDHISQNIVKSYVVKHNRRIKAKIYQYSETRFSVEINGLQWDKTTLNECIEKVKDNYQSFLEALNFSEKIQVVQLFKPIKA